MGATRGNVNSVLGGRYEIVCPLNQGSFGTVSLARDIRTDALVAVKCIPKATNAANEAYQELQYQAALATHPNIVNLLDSFEDAAASYIVMEYCADGDMYEAINSGRGPSDHLGIKSFMLQLISAVQHMHSKGIYHRDIKPENIFLAEDGSCKLGDFGLATHLAWCDESNIGSERYMSPEQYNTAASGFYSPEKADLWALGICLLNVLFHKSPFVVPSEEDKLFKDYAQDRESLYDVFPTMSPETFEALSHVLQADPSKRNLEEFRDAILNVSMWTTDDDEDDDLFMEDYDYTPAQKIEPVPKSQPFFAALPWTHLLGKPEHKQRPAKKSAATTALEFPKQEVNGWTQSAVEFPKMEVNAWTQPVDAFGPSSVDSGLGMSLSEVNLNKLADVTRPENIKKPSMVSIANKFAAKSWSDLVDEEEEEEEERERAEQLKRRSWSFESEKDYTQDEDHWVGGWEMSV